MPLLQRTEEERTDRNWSPTRKSAESARPSQAGNLLCPRRIQSAPGTAPDRGKNAGSGFGTQGVGSKWKQYRSPAHEMPVASCSPDPAPESGRDAEPDAPRR